ncbi:uncharacterized protein LOC135810158 isoform X1 [Sycon ciliatum]|uniref:uncharacterized protein LOC135810158 isoform X1 n=1 Tax=Sycon ciliatum TaxID=27933 RepID=UPI0031F695FD
MARLARPREPHDLNGLLLRKGLLPACLVLYVCTSTGQAEMQRSSEDVQAFCLLYLNENLTSAFCTMTCASVDNVLIGFHLQGFLIDKFTDFLGDDGIRYKWNPCTALNVEGSNTCAEDADSSMCEEETTGTWKVLGTLPPSNISLHTVSFGDGLTFTLHYTYEDVEADVEFYCREGETPGTINADPDKEVPRRRYRFVIESSYACATAITPTRPTSAPGTSIPLSTGTIVIISLIGILVLYILVGMTYKATVNGARGVEMIPNIDVWTRLLSTIRFGAAWLVSPCYKGRASKELNYSTIKSSDQPPAPGQSEVASHTNQSSFEEFA